MVQKTDPFIGSNYGWDDGENMWGEGMNENLLQNAFLHDRRIDGIVSSLPSSPSNGEAYFLTTDNLAYYRVDNQWYFTEISVGSELRLKSDGTVYQFNGTTLIEVPDPAVVQSELNSKTTVISSFSTLLTTPAFLGQVVTTRGHTNEGLGSLSYVAKSGTVLNNGGTRINSATSGLYWEALLKGPITAYNFGALGNKIANDSVAINLAITYLSSVGGGTLLLERGEYLLNNPIELVDKIEIIGDRGAVIFQGIDNLELIRSVSHAYFSSIRNLTANGNGKVDGVFAALNNFRLGAAGIYDCYVTDIENGIFFLGGCFGTPIENFTAYDGCPNPIVMVENAATAVIRNPNLDNVSGRWAGTGYGIQIQNDTIPNEGVIVDGGYIQGFQRGVWDEGRGTRGFGTYFEQCTEADVYLAGAIQCEWSGTQHFAAIGTAAYLARQTDGCTVINPNMGSGGRIALYDVDATNTNFNEYRAGSDSADNTPLGNMTYISSLVSQRKATFLPIVQGSTIAGSATSYSVQSGKVVRHGNILNVEISVAWAGHDGTGGLIISGIPTGFTPITFLPLKMGQCIPTTMAYTGPVLLSSFAGTGTIRTVQVSTAGVESLLLITASGRVDINITCTVD